MELLGESCVHRLSSSVDFFFFSLGKMGGVFFFVCFFCFVLLLVCWFVFQAAVSECIGKEYNNCIETKKKRKKKTRTKSFLHVQCSQHSNVGI